jgi:hypothetical protein
MLMDGGTEGARVAFAGHALAIAASILARATLARQLPCRDYLDVAATSARTDARQIACIDRGDDGLHVVNYTRAMPSQIDLSDCMLFALRVARDRANT